VGSSRLDRIVAGLERRGCAAVLHRAAAAADIERLAREAGQDCDIVVAAGGDGTINAVANGLALAPRDMPLAVLPLGTANVLAREIGLPRDPDRLAELIVTGAARPIWPGRIGDRLFLTCVGSLQRSPATVQRLSEQIEAEGLEDHVRLAGELDAAALEDCYDAADLFVLPTRHEGYGMAVAEALARGIPVISTPTGAIADLVGRDAGMLVPPDDFQALTATLWRVLEDEQLRQRLREGARRVRERLPTWQEQAGKMAEVLARAAADHGRVQL